MTQTLPPTATPGTAPLGAWGTIQGSFYPQNSAQPELQPSKEVSWNKLCWPPPSKHQNCEHPKQQLTSCFQVASSYGGGSREGHGQPKWPGKAALMKAWADQTQWALDSWKFVSRLEKQTVCQNNPINLFLQPVTIKNCTGQVKEMDIDFIPRYQ